MITFKEHIVKVGNKYRLVSKKTGKNLGTYPSKAGAEKRERQVQYFKHMGESAKLKKNLKALISQEYFRSLDTMAKQRTQGVAVGENKVLIKQKINSKTRGSLGTAVSTVD